MATYDIACFRTHDSSVDMVQQLFATDGGLLIVGSQKLAQRVIIELLTEQGSQQYVNRGCEFMTRLREEAYSEFDVLVAFAIAKPTLLSNLTAEESTTDDPAERYVDSDIDQVIVGPEFVSLRLNIMSRAGLLTSIVLPPLVFVF